MESNGGRVIVVKNWHVLLTLLLWAASFIAGWATLRAQTDDNTRRIQDMDEKHVRKEQFGELRDDIIRRLDRIERKVDQERQH